MNAEPRRVYRRLRAIRVAIQAAYALVLVVSILAAGALWDALASALATLQFAPALVRALGGGLSIASGAAVAAVVMTTVLTLVFGRLYCSALCPLGAVMDAAAVASGKGRAKRPYRYRKRNPFLRWPIFAATALAAVFGLPLLLDLLDPWSIFARGIRSLGKPVVGIAVAGVDAIARLFGRYGPPPVRIEADVLVMAISSLAFALIVAAAVANGRWFCDRLCPVGAALELLARRARFRPRIADSCVRCGACERVCRTSCVDHAAKAVDASRCVVCLDCVSVCPNGSIAFAVSRPKETRAPVSVPESGPAGNPERGPLSRREFLVAGATGAAALAVTAGAASSRRVTPSGAIRLSGIERRIAVAPGAGALARYASRCTACGLCVARCPTGVLVHASPRATGGGASSAPSVSPSTAARTNVPPTGALTPRKAPPLGIKGVLFPFMDYSRAFCSYDCAACSNVCPTGALSPLSVEAKRTVSIAESKLELPRCIVITQGTPCGACAEHCPTGAVSMAARTPGKPPEPYLTPDLCIGCGACETVCPAAPLKAIWAEGRAVHAVARIPSGGGETSGDEGFKF